MNTQSASRWALVAISACALLACEGRGTATGAFGELPEYTPDGKIKDPTTLTPLPDPDCEEVRCQREMPVGETRLLRMTHLQWENATRDILRLDARSGLSSTFKDDTLPPGHFNRDQRALEIDGDLWEDYRQGAEDVVALVVSDPAALDRITPAGAPSEARPKARAILAHMGRRAYRRPMTDAELDRHMSLYDEAPMHFDPGADAFTSGLTLMLRALFQSPYFLYRLELTPAEGAPTRLAGYEVASKLAMALWNSVPDEELLDAAAAGSLDSVEGVREQAERMMAHEYATQMILDHYDQMFHFRDWTVMRKEDPSFDEGVADAMRQEMELFFEDIIMQRSGTLQDLMTSRDSYVNETLAPIYGLDGISGAELRKVDLGDKRPGMLTRAGFMAYKAGADQPAPVQRGLFINEHITCSNLPPAPNDINGDPFEGPTNRARWTNMTEGCGGGCHVGYLNPPGFSFENFDELGRWREMDGGQAVDASGTYNWDGNQLTFTDAPDMIAQLAVREDVHHCYAEHWFEYLYGREPAPEEAPLVARMAHTSLQETLSIKEAIVSMVTSDAFLYRAPNK